MRVVSFVRAASQQMLVVGGLAGASGLALAQAPPAGMPETAAYLGNQRQTDLLFIHGLDDRTAGPPWASGQGWLRAGGQGMKSTSDTGRYDADSKAWLLQGGAEFAKRSYWGWGDRWHLGVMASVAGQRTDATALATAASARGESSGGGLGAYGTWFQNDISRLGWYTDLWSQYGWFNNHVEAPGIDRAQYNSHIFLGSGEVGYAFGLSPDAGWVLTPQAQIVYVHNHSYPVTQSNGQDVEGSHHGAYTARFGVRLQRGSGASAATSDAAGGWRFRPYAALNWWHDSLGNEVIIAGVSTRDLYPKDRFEVKGGMGVDFNRQWGAWGDLGWQTGSQSFQSWVARFGARYAW